jgi:CheY-like chemotaxis protein
MTSVPTSMDHRRILIVDDNRELCENLKDIFDSYGFFVTCVFDGQQAIQKAAQELPQIVLMDVQMPVMDGLTALKKIKQLAPKACVWLMTANIIPDLIDAARRAGAAATLSKPLDFEKIRRMIAGEQDS